MVFICSLGDELIWNFLSMDQIHAIYNGNFDNLEDIKVSPLSRAYTFSDSVYEVIPFFNNEVIAFNRHIERLQYSCRSMNIDANIDQSSKEILQLISLSKIKDGYVYYQISRGVDPIRSHMYSSKLRAETFGYVTSHKFEEQTLKVALCEDIRWQRCDIKSTSLLGNVLSMNEAKDQACDEVIMYKENMITEGGASNVFFIKNNRIFTPSLSSNILPGITRELLISEAAKHEVKIMEQDCSLDDLVNAESVWLTSSTKGLAPVSEIINQNSNLDVSHPLFKKCQNIFNDAYFKE